MPYIVWVYIRHLACKGLLKVHSNVKFWSLSLCETVFPVCLRVPGGIIFSICCTVLVCLYFPTKQEYPETQSHFHPSTVEQWQKHFTVFDAFKFREIVDILDPNYLFWFCPWFSQERSHWDWKPPFQESPCCITTGRFSNEHALCGPFSISPLLARPWGELSSITWCGAARREEQGPCCQSGSASFLVSCFAGGHDTLRDCRYP